VGEGLPFELSPSFRLEKFSATWGIIGSIVVLCYMSGVIRMRKAS
jgi:hypothetical protein